MKRTAILAAALAAGPPAFPAAAEALVIDGARAIDFAEAEPRIVENSAILIVNGKVQAVVPRTKLAVPEGTRRIDAGGLTAIPGLSDMHVHVWDEAELGAYLGSGITTVRNLSGMPFHLDLQRRIEAGELAGPRLITSGPILNSAGPNQQLNHQLVETAEQARAAVRQQYQAGYRRLKVYSNLKREPYEALLDEARRLEMRITGHTPEGFRHEGVPFERPFAIGFDEILGDGFETIEHVESILWHGLADRRDEEAGRALARRIAASGAVVTPTLVAHRNIVRVIETGGAFASRPGAGRLNPVVLELDRGGIEYWASQSDAIERDRSEKIAWLAGLLREQGVPIVTGSDAGIFVNAPGESLFDEFELLVDAGYRPAEVLRASTRNAAMALGEAGESGCLATGCRADLVLYACDPLADISCTRNPVAVLRQGRFLDRAALDALLAASERHDPERTIANLVEGMAAQGAPIDPAIFGN